MTFVSANRVTSHEEFQSRSLQPQVNEGFSRVSSFHVSLTRTSLITRTFHELSPLHNEQRSTNPSFSARKPEQKVLSCEALKCLLPQISRRRKPGLTSCLRDHKPFFFTSSIFEAGTVRVEPTPQATPCLHTLSFVILWR